MQSETEAIAEKVEDSVVTSAHQTVSIILQNHEVHLDNLDDIAGGAEPPDNDGVNTVYLQKDDGVLQEDESHLVSDVDEHNKGVLCKVTDGQPVQLEDGTMAYLHTTAREGAQPIQLEDGTTAYICQTPPDNTFISPPQPNQDVEALDAGKAAVAAIGDLAQANEMSPDNASLVKFNMTSERILQLGEKAFRCTFDGCGRLYTTQHHLKVHERSHTGDRPFRCEYAGCGKGFATGYGLKSHTRVHTGEKPYKCPEERCEKAFKTSGDLQKHIRIHTGERPFKCPFEGCDRSFTTSNIRKVHIRTHTGEKPYVCQEEGCGRSFASATNYKNHIRIHTGEKPYVCTVQGCNKRFTEYSSLYKHHVVHTHQKPYVCNHCGKTYRQTSTLAMHKRTAHNEETGLEIEAPYVQNTVNGPPPMKRPHIDYSAQDEPREGALVINTSDAQQQVAMVAGMTGDQAIAALQGGRLQSGQVVTVSTGEQGEQIYVVTDPSQLLQLGLQVEQQPMTHEDVGEDGHNSLSIVHPAEGTEDMMQSLVRQ